MALASHSTPDDQREVSRKVRDAGGRVATRPALEIADARSVDVDRESLFAAIEELRAANRIKDEMLLRERKGREQAEAANRAASEVLALLSHQFRTPLQAIFGYLELLEREIHGPLTDAQRRDLQRIAQSQQHLLRLITAKLDIASPESLAAFGIKPTRDPVDPKDR